MIDVVTADNAHIFQSELRSFFELRFEVFVNRLKWDLACEVGDERDQFDNERAIYLLLTNSRAQVVAGARMLRTDIPSLLTQVFPFLVDGPMPGSPSIWEVTRLVVDHRKERLEGCGNVCGRLLSGLLEFGVDNGLSHLVSVSDTRIERILRRSGWTTQRLGAAHRIGECQVAAEIQECSPEILDECRRRTGTNHVVLRYPADVRKAA
jgi:acyl homoserine lactone synthase